MAGRDVTSRAEQRLESALSLPFFERLAPAPASDDLAAAIDAWTKPGEIVVDLHGRGGWVARTAIGGQRRAADFEAHPLSRLLAEVVLRPPDVRHLDAAAQAIGASPLGGSSVRSTIDALYASRCATCGRTVALESLIWEVCDAGTRAVRREYRCLPCREQLGGPDLRHADPEQGDLELALAIEPKGAIWQALARRFPTPREEHPLPDQLLGLHTPRQLLGLHAILDRIDGELRAAPITAALRLALLGALLPASRLNAYPGRLASLRIVNGQVKLPSGNQWRERNPWLAFEDGYRLVRGFVQRLEAGAQRVGFARFGPDVLALEEGTSNVALAESTPSAFRRLAVQGERIAMSGAGSRIRLVLGQPPLRWTPERLAATYHATAWILGHEAASMLPFEQLFAPVAKAGPDAEIASQARSLAVVAPGLSPSAHAVVLLDAGTPEALVTTILGGEAAGYRLIDARLHRHGGDSGPGSVVLVPPGGVMPPGPRTRANRPLPPTSGGVGDPATIPGRGIFGAPQRIDDGPYRPSLVAEAVTETAVEVLKAHGEPATFERLLGDLLVGLDRSGQLARLAKRWRPTFDENGVWRPYGEPGRNDGGAADAPSKGDLDAGTPGSVAPRSGQDLEPEALTPRPAGAAPAATLEPDAVAELLALIRGELDRPNNRRIRQLGPGEYWLAGDDDRADAASPLADRVEWAAFGLLSASSAARQLTEATFFERMASLFGNRDGVDETLLKACLQSYCAPTSSPEAIVCTEQLESLSAEHDALIGELADLGHTLGLRVWIGRRQQTRRVHGRPLSSWLDEDELNVHLPLVARGPEEELERIDCAWYVPHKAAFLFEVEWTAMLGDPILTRHSRIPTEEGTVRFLVLPPERAALAGFKLAHSALLRRAVEDGNWHFVKSNHLRAFAALESPSLDGLEPYLGLEASADSAGEQLPLF